jgi:hypothetical protein
MTPITRALGSTPRVITFLQVNCPGLLDAPTSSRELQPRRIVHHHGLPKGGLLFVPICAKLSVDDHERTHDFAVPKVDNGGAVTGLKIAELWQQL